MVGTDERGARLTTTLPFMGDETGWQYTVR